MALEERRRTRLDEFMVWALESSLDKAKDRPIVDLLSAAEGRVAVGLLVSIGLGFLFDYSFRFTGVDQSVTYVLIGAFIGAIVGLVAGGAGGGAGGAALGGFWGWLGGKLIQSLVTDTLQRNGHSIRPAWDVGGWLAAAGVGWVAGKLIRHVYPKSANGAGKFITAAIAITAFTLLLWGGRDEIQHHPRISTILTIHHAWLIAYSLWALTCVFAGVIVVRMVIEQANFADAVRSPLVIYNWYGQVIHPFRYREPVMTAREWLIEHHWMTYLLAISCTAALGATGFAKLHHNALAGAGYGIVTLFPWLLLLSWLIPSIFPLAGFIMVLAEGLFDGMKAVVAKLISVSRNSGLVPGWRRR